MTQQAFWKPRPIAPTAPDKSRLALTLRWSLRVSVAGWIVYGAFAYAFADLEVIPTFLQSIAVILGSVLIVAGAESNTIATSEIALSKLGTDRISKWDIAAVIASLVGGICTPLLTFSTRQPAYAGTGWREWVVKNGPLALGVAGVLDFYGAVTELALFRRDYERALADWVAKMETWRKEEQEWNEEHGITPQIDRSSWRKAKISDVRRLAERLNGDAVNVTADNLQEYLDDLNVRVDHSDTTISRWLKVLENGG